MSEPIDVEEMRRVLKARGYNYGRDAAANAAVGYDIAKAQMQAALDIAMRQLAEANAEIARMRPVCLAALDWREGPRGSRTTWCRSEVLLRDAVDAESGGDAGEPEHDGDHAADAVVDGALRERDLPDGAPLTSEQ
jgi:hypothetical protein